jgi:hypothetical protein
MFTTTALTPTAHRRARRFYPNFCVFCAGAQRCDKTSSWPLGFLRDLARIGAWSLEVRSATLSRPAGVRASAFRLFFAASRLCVRPLPWRRGGLLHPLQSPKPCVFPEKYKRHLKTALSGASHLSKTPCFPVRNARKTRWEAKKINYVSSHRPRPLSVLFRSLDVEFSLSAEPGGDDRADQAGNQ